MFDTDETFTWRKVRIQVGAFDDAPHDSRAWPVRISYQGRAAEFTIKAGSGWRPNAQRVIGHLACFAQYAFIDGYPDHGVVSLPDLFASLGDEVDEDRMASDYGYRGKLHTEYAHWLAQAFTFAAVVGDLLSDAQECE